MAKSTAGKHRKGKSAIQKRDQQSDSDGKVVAIPRRMQKRMGKGTLLIPAPRDVDAVMRRTKLGRLVTQSTIRAKLAAKAGADHACPLCTGIFARIAAEAAEEERRDGIERITPWWRTIKDNGALNEKFPGGTAAQAVKLQAEGFKIVAGSGKQPPKVADFEKYLVRA